MRHKWRRPASDFPDRKHTANLALALAAKREESRKEAEELWQRFIEEAPPIEAER